MSYVHAIDGLRATARTFMDYDAPHMVEEIGGPRAKQAKSGLLALVKDGGQYVELIANHLLRAEPVYWSPEMCDMLAQVTPGIPDWTLRMSDLLCEDGFAWFSKPLDLGVMQPMADGSAVPMRLGGLLWGTVRFRIDPSLGRQVTLTHLGDDESGECWVIYCPIILLDREPRLCGGASWAEGESLTGLLASDEAKRAAPDEAWAEMVGKVFAATMALMEQHIVSADRVTLNRTDRKRLDREGWIHEPTVRVVKLRRVARGEHEHDGGKAYELTCQFVVRGHWRNQFYPSTNEHRPLFVLPYWKGPEGAPLKAQADRVFEVTR